MCFSVQSLGWEDPLEGGMATYSNILAWRILWSEEPGGLQPIRLQRVRHNWSDWAWCIFKYILLPQVFLSLYSHLTRGALGISNPHMNFGDIWDRDPCSWSLEYKVKWIVIILLYMVGWAIDKIMRNMLDRQQRGNASLFSTTQFSLKAQVKSVRHSEPGLLLLLLSHFSHVQLCVTP